MIDRLVETVDVPLEELVDALAVRTGLDPGGGDHVVDARVGEARELGLRRDQLEVVRKGPFPGKLALLLTVLLEPRAKVYGHCATSIWLWSTSHLFCLCCSPGSRLYGYRRAHGSFAFRDELGL